MSLDHAIREIVREELARLLGVRGTHYTSSSPPPGVARRSFNRQCAAGRVPGAHKEGRSWVATVEAWQSRGRAAPTLTDEEIAMQALKNALA